MAKEGNKLTDGLWLKVLLREQKLSMRKFSELTGVDTSTISRIINGKRRATHQHLERFSDCLGVSLMDLFKAAGYSVKRNQSDSVSHTYTYMNMIQEFVSPNASVQEIEKRLESYAKLSKTDEGNERILLGYVKKLDSVGHIGPLINEIKDLFNKFELREGTPKELALIGGALLYFIIPADAIHDYLFAIGYLDDVIAVQLTLTALKRK